MNSLVTESAIYTTTLSKDQTMSCLNKLKYGGLHSNYLGYEAEVVLSETSFIIDTKTRYDDESQNTTLPSIEGIFLRNEPVVMQINITPNFIILAIAVVLAIFYVGLIMSTDEIVLFDVNFANTILGRTFVIILPVGFAGVFLYYYFAHIIADSRNWIVEELKLSKINPKNIPS